MKEGWRNTKLNEICENLDSKRIPITKNKRLKGEFPYYGASGIVDYVQDYLFDEELLLVSEDGANLLARAYPIAFSIEGKNWVNNHAHVLRFENIITQRYVEYFLNSIRLEPYVSGMAQPKLNQRSLNSIQIPIPPLPEQKAIVKILDEAFAKIDQAKANIEKNIENAKELFQSKLNEIFSQRREGWEEKTFKEICVLQRGFDLPKRLRSKGKYDLVTSSGVKDSHSEYKVEGPGVITGRSGSIGNVFYVENRFWPLNTALYIKDFKGNYEKYIYYFLREFDLSQYASGAGVPTLNRNFVHDVVVLSTVNVEEQKAIVETLDLLEMKIEKVKSFYLNKLISLDDLKKAILQKAFSGELTKMSELGLE